MALYIGGLVIAQSREEYNQGETPDGDKYLPYSFYVASEGMLGLAEATNQPEERSYSDGIVLPPKIVRGGKDFTIDILLTDLGDRSVSSWEILESYDEIVYEVKEDTVYIYSENASDIGGAQCQRIEFLQNDLSRVKKSALIRMYFTADTW